MKVEKNPAIGNVVELFGPTVEFLTSPQDTESDFCVLKGTIPRNPSVPIHSHPDTGDFLIISGELKFLRQVDGIYDWIKANSGDHIHVPSNVSHAWRNLSGSTAIANILTTKKMGQFFQEVGRPYDNAVLPLPTHQELAHFATVSRKYGYWNATTEENEMVGINISF